MSQNLTKKAKTLSIQSSGCSPKSSNPYSLKKTISTFSSSTRSQSDAKDSVCQKKSSKRLTPALSLQKLGLLERNEDSLKINLFQAKDDDINSRIRNLLTEPKTASISKITRKEPVVAPLKKEKIIQAKASHAPIRLEKKGIQMNPLSLSNLNEMILKEFEMGKQSHSRRDYEGMGSFPLSARGHEDNTSKVIRNRRSHNRNSESGQKLASLCKATGTIERLERMEDKNQAKTVVKSKVRQQMKGLNSEADSKMSSKVKRYTLTNTSKTEKSICGSTTKESMPRQGGEYFTKLFSAQAQKSVSPKESLNKIEEKKKLKAKAQNVYGLKNLNLKALSTDLEGKKKGDSLTGSISNRQPLIKSNNTRQCDTDRPKTSAETVGSICNYTTARKTNDKNGFTSERRMQNGDSEIQSLIDLLEEDSREETTVFEASGCQSRKTLKSEKDFDGDNYINSIISKVQKDFRDSTGRNPTWCIDNTESKNQALILINNFCSN